ncbi:hypothetical protein TUZN_1136 [Thermoproteus uzoniensis 768-20]|uniref:Uncharacterized protein n=1 Tax=Thermoproteus uzoniensis (strain 768-20) TaxID=999630 RepID=F2L0D4_THEU7|nr:hypothetical protein [Thermoproteus uzoniensis]AEA12616.1 hypothetical protein TUZN_1136 [Thermoproteus uzoniensis 768-20]
MAEILEARFQRAVFQGSEEVLEADFEARYGPRWRALLEAAEGAGEDDVKAAEARAGELAALVSSRVDDERTAALYAKYARSLAVEGQLRIGLDLLGLPEALERLIRWGLAMHFSDDVVAAPPYLAGLLSRYMASGPAVEVDVVGELSALGESSLALIEGEVAGDADWELYEEVYGPKPRSRLVMGRLAAYDPEHGLVVNPATYPDQVLEALLSLKERRARRVASALGLHGEYEFDERSRCGLAYLSMDGTAEGSAEVYVCPWIAVPISVSRGGRVNKVFVIWGSPPSSGLRRRRDMFVFLYEEGAKVFYPERQRPVHEHLVDLLYRSGLAVAEE